MSTRDALIDRVLWGSCALWFGTILWASLAASEEELLAFPNADKVLHFLSYFGFAALLLLTAVWRPGRGTGSFPTSGRVVLVSVVVLGALLEVAQGVWFERTADIVDGVANLAGVAVAHRLWRVLKWQAGT